MIGAVIQARMGSTRLPGKVLMDLGGQPVLWHVIQRAAKVPELQKVVVATSKEPQDDIIAQRCKEWHVPCYRGDEQDVLDRYWRAAALHCLHVVVRITADCPLLDPSVVSQVIQRFLTARCDYASNVHPPTYPDGLDCEVMTIEALEAAWAETGAGTPFEREHVTPYIWRNGGSSEGAQQFFTANISSTGDYAHLRWTVDTPEDLERVRILLGRQGGITDYRKLL